MSDVDQSLIDIQKAIEARLPLGKRTASTNGREHFSNYFAVVDGRLQSGEHSPERFYAHVLVLGDRRPYTIQVVVRRERRISQGSALSPIYEEVAQDHRLEKILARRIHQALSKRREDRNIIDDFRVF